MDKISSLVGRYSFNARVFFNGDFCDSNEFREDSDSGHLHLVRKGPVIFSHGDDAPVRIDEPTMVFYPRGMRHRLQIPKGESATLLCATISFEGGSRNMLARILPDCLRLPLGQVAAMGQTLDLLFAEAGSAAEGRDLLLDRLCEVLMIQVIRHQFASGRLPVGVLAGLADRHLALALNAIHERPHEPWRLESLCQLACMSRARFTGHFREVVGMPPGEYLARWRIGLGQDLLRKGLPVKVVSGRIGYISAAAFTRAFSAHVGMSPRQWLRESGTGLQAG